jgi:alginate O-acetyltransferase complex protein AlgI
VLLIASLIFYAWGEPIYILVMMISTLLNYILGIFTEKAVNKGKYKKVTIIAAVALNLGILIFFKYANFFVDNFNLLLNAIHIKSTFSMPKIPLPIGISFYTFHLLSYILDIFRKKEKAQRNILDLMLYISFFPQLVAGPIIKYNEIASQLKKREVDIIKIRYGIERFVLGLGKKLIIADTLGKVADSIYAQNVNDLTFWVAWLGAICYTMQIYFDFSAYSDMAIGLAKIFGFEFMENFNYPYISKSVQEFWRRWHISLSTWFRDYLYIPLGGSRKGNVRTALNTLIVFTLCGFWHGATWSFLVWGIYYGIILVLEKFVYGKYLKKLWIPLQHSYTLLIVIIGWVLFRADNLLIALRYISVMFNFGHLQGFNTFQNTYLTLEIKSILVIAVLASMPIMQIFYKMWARKKYTILFNTVHLTTTISTFLLSIIYLSKTLDNATKIPFIYFRF